MTKLQLVLIIGIGGACSPFSPDLGQAPYLCAETEPRCPDGYACLEDTASMPSRQVCVAAGGGIPAIPDTGPTLLCADDSNVETPTRNDTPQTAFVTPIDQLGDDVSLAGLSICPEGDKDHYAFSISAPGMKFVELIVTWETGPAVSASILNATGLAIQNAAAMGETGVRACVDALPAGMYFASVFAEAGTKNNYRMSIKILPTCG